MVDSRSAPCRFGFSYHERGGRLFWRSFAASCQARGLALITRQLLLPLVMAEVYFRHAKRFLVATAATTAVATTTAAASAAAIATATAAAATAAGLVLSFVHTQ